MWQENVGADRESPARMLFPVMSVLSLDDEIMVMLEDTDGKCAGASGCTLE